MNKTVLIVEDEPTLREILATTLKTEGYGVLEAANGQEAIDYLRTTDRAQPNMILMDLMMPGMDGWAFRSELLRDPLLAYIPIVVISGNSNVTRVAKSMRASAHLAKPFSMGKLVETVESHWLDDTSQEKYTQAVIDTMQIAVHRLSNLIASLLQDAPFADDRLIIKTRTLDIEVLVTKIAENHREQALKNDISLQISLAPNLTQLSGDAAIIELILNNLIDDTLQTMTGGEVKISVFMDQDAHCIAVQNRGGSHRIVNAADTAATSGRPVTPGVGLGLTLVREILASLKAHLELQTEPDGNTFTLILPALNPAQQPRVV